MPTGNYQRMNERERWLRDCKIYARRKILKEDDKNLAVEFALHRASICRIVQSIDFWIDTL